jgi:hypothetical protein
MAHPITEFVAERVASLLIGLVLGLIIAVGLLVFVADIDLWWILVVVPAACGIVCALVGDRAVEVFKHVASWAGH